MLVSKNGETAVREIPTIIIGKGQKRKNTASPDQYSESLKREKFLPL
jgi:hypothetical protein